MRGGMRIRGKRGGRRRKDKKKVVTSK